MRSSILFVHLSALVGTAVSLPNIRPVAGMKRANAVEGCSGDKNQRPRLFVIPPKPSDTSKAPRPDASHPFIAPGPTDQRGPCPAMNTLANHGYIPRSGIATTEEIIMGVMEGLNMEHDFATFVGSLATLTRGNANIAMLSIGFNDSRVPPLPGCIDGPVAGGLAKHGRFEGDMSLTRRDAHIGDSVHFQEDLLEEFVNDYVSKYGEDSPDGPKTLINLKAVQEFKYDTFGQYQQEDKEIAFHADRQLTSYSETAFLLDILAGENNNSQTLTVNRMRSFFQDQTFPAGFERRDGAAGILVLAPTASAVRDAHPIPPGGNDADGNYVADTPAVTDIICPGYTALVENIAAVLDHQSGILGQNVETMINAMFKPFHDSANCTTMARPKGMAGL